MFGEFGYFALVVGLLISIGQAMLPLVAIIRKQYFWQQRAAALAIASALCVLTSFACLEASFLSNDFSLVYVAEHSNTLLPWYYKMSAVWGGHEGSMLLWVSILAIWSIAVAVKSRVLPLAITSRVFSILGMISAGMLSFIIFTSSPFTRDLPILPVDGLDLNPLLQDIGLIVHPPILYTGYVGLAVPFAFAIAGLWAGRLDSIWAGWCKSWVITAWSFLTLGIAIGSWWAYYELGWGGWWFWDPVENASFMPWLAATAFLHTLIVTEKRGVFKAWTVLLAILAFALSLLGTFLVRSGVLTSVHAFAADPSRGLFVLCILCAVVGGGLLLFALRGWQLNQESTHQVLSKETFIFINNLILMVATSVVLLGTLYPLIADTFGLGRLSVGPPYFNAFFAPLTWLLLVFMAVAPLMRWKAQAAQQWRENMLAMIATVLTAILVVVGFALTVQGKHTAMTALTIALCIWVFGLLLADFVKKVKNSSSIKASIFRRIPASYFSMQLAHSGLLVVILGVTLTTHMSIEHDVALREGQTVELGSYSFHFDQIKQLTGPNYDATQAVFHIFQHGQLVSTLKPEKRVYFAQSKSMTEAAIDGSLARDLYIALGDPLDPDVTHPAWAVRVYVKPFVRLLWLGALLMALGGFLSAFDKRKKKLAQSTDTQVINANLS